MKLKYTLTIWLTCFALFVFATSFDGGLKISDIQVKHPTSKRKANGEITVTINNGTAPYYYYLSKTPAPVSEGDFIMKSPQTSQKNYVFSELHEGTYFLIISDSKDGVIIKRIILDHKASKN